ncbi:MAG: DUF692 family protein [Candidatus Saganbacteria bacterium]|nr:DUF692 family protein [Candidatus Saganbacteria bacterium]
MRTATPKFCVEVGKFGLMSHRTPVSRSPLVKLADAFELKTPQRLAQVHALRTGTAEMRDSESRRLAEILATGKEITYHGNGIIDDQFTGDFAAAGHVARLDPSGIGYTSFSIGPSNLRTLRRKHDEIVFEGEPLTRAQLWTEIADRLRTLRSGYRGRLGFENEAYQPRVAHVFEPDFLTEFFTRHPDTLFLLDLAHARVTANSLVLDPLEYFRALPLNKIGHIHLSHPAWLIGTGRNELALLDTHEAPREEDLGYLDQVLSLMGRVPEYLTIEYFRNESQMVEAYQRVRRFFEPAPGKSPLARDFTLLELSLQAAEERIAALGRYDRERIAAINREHMTAKQEAIFQRLLEIEDKRGLVTDSPKNVALHTTNVFTAYIQATTATYEDLAASKDHHQLERLCLCQDRKRVEANLSRLKASLTRYAPSIWHLLISRHDDGKVISAPLHERETGALDRKFGLLDKPAFARLTAKEKILLAELMEHHTNLGTTYVGDNSMLIFKEVFGCPRLRKLLEGPKGKIDLAAVRTLLDLWAAFTCLDASGLGPKGMLTNSRLEYYYQTTADFYDVFERNATNYIAALTEIETYAQGSFLARLCEIMVSFDANGDSKVLPWEKDLSHFSFYLQNIEAALAGLTTRGEITGADWEELRNTFHQIIELPYIASWYSIAWSNPGVDKNSPQADATLYDGFLKYLMLLNKAGRGCREICVIKGKGAEVIRSADALDDFLPQLRPVIDRARGLITETGKTYFADGSGRAIGRSPVMFRQGTTLFVDLSPARPA